MKALHPGGTFDTASLTAHIFLDMKRQAHLSVHINSLVLFLQVFKISVLFTGYLLNNTPFLMDIAKCPIF